MEGWFSTAREVAHAAAAIVGQLMSCVGLVVLVLGLSGIHVTNDQVSWGLLIAGQATTLLSKGIDSLNDAIRTKGTAPVSGPTA